jgi:hypothetical protein
LRFSNRSAAGLRVIRVSFLQSMPQKKPQSRKKSKQEKKNPLTDPNQDGSQTKCNSDTKVHGAVEIHIPKNLLDQHKAEREEDAAAQITERAKNRGRERLKLVLEVLGFLVLCAYAGFTLWIACSTQGQLTVARNQFDAAQRNFEIDQRPWVALSDTTLTQPLQFTSNGASLAFKYTLSNAGRTPAIFVNIQSKLRPIQLTTYTGADFTNLLIDQCRPTPQMQDSTISFPGDPRLPVFPGDSALGVQMPQIGTKDLEAGWKASEAEHHALPGESPIALIVCVDYQFNFKQGHHQSRYAFQLGKPLSVGNGIYGGFSGFAPEGTYPDVRFMVMGQSVD